MTGRRRSKAPRLGLTAIILCLGFAVLAAEVWLPGPLTAVGQTTDITLNKGEGLGPISKRLRDGGVIRSSLVFGLVAEVTGAGRRLKAGEYEFISRESLWSVLQQIRTGAVVNHHVTVPEGVTSETVAQILQKTPFLTGDAPVADEGAILPETYEARRGETRSQVLDRMVAARDKVLATLWAERSTGLPFKTPEEAAILASVVERETAKADERPHVAAVYINRLRTGMRLESDPAVIYGLTGGAPLGHGLRVSELARITPYNTYKITGLPPTPIGNPGRASLAAVLRPAKSDDLFFVADGTGGHRFAATFAAHQKNVAAWRTIEQARAK